jgi:hypothetical protein
MTQPLPQTCPLCDSPKQDARPLGAEIQWTCGSFMRADGEIFYGKDCEETDE